MKTSKQSPEVKNSFYDYTLHGVYYSVYGLFKYIPSPIGDPLRYIITKFFIKEIGRVRISEGVTLRYPNRISLGNNISINEGAYIGGYGRVTIGDSTRIGHRSSIISADHKYSDKTKPIYKQGLVGEQVIIGKNVWIGCHVIILKGVTVGENVVIGAGSVVTKSIKDNQIVAGIPAKPIKK